MTDTENTSFIIGAMGIGISIIFVVMGWLPIWILFGVLVIAALLYNSKFFATGITGGFGTGVFASMGWFPLWGYFSAVVLATVLLAVKVAGMYINTGQNK